MKTNSIVPIIVFGIVGLLVSVTVLVPIIEASSVTTVENNGETPLRFDQYSTFAELRDAPDHTYTFSKSGNNFEMTIDGVTKTGTLQPMTVLATQYHYIFVDDDLKLNASYYTRSGYSWVQKIATDLTSVSLTKTGNNIQYEQEYAVGCNYAYLPSFNGLYGTYSKPVSISDTDLIMGGNVFANSYFIYGRNTYSNLSEGEVIVDKSDGMLNSISYVVDSESTVETPEIDRDSYFDGLGNVVSTVDIPNLSPSLENVNVTLFDDNTFRCNSITTNSPQVSIYSMIEYSGTSYNLKVLGDGINPILPTNVEYNNVDCTGEDLIINDNAFKGLNTSYFNLYECIFIGDSAFENSTVTANSLTGGEYIGDSAFKNSSGFDIPSDAIYIGTSAYEGATMGYIYLYGESMIIEDSAFKNAIITEVTLGDGVVSLGVSAFEGCTRLAETYNSYGIPFILPNSLKSVGDRAFYNTPFDGVVNRSNATFGTSVFSSTTEVLNLGETALSDTVGTDKIMNGFESSNLFGLAPGKAYAEGGVWDLLPLLPLFSLIGVLVGVIALGFRRM